jgi:hypothetical protein
MGYSMASSNRPSKALDEAEALLLAYPPNHPDYADFGCCGGNDDAPKAHTMDCDQRVRLCLRDLLGDFKKLWTYCNVPDRTSFLSTVGSTGKDSKNSWTNIALMKMSHSLRSTRKK